MILFPTSHLGRSGLSILVLFARLASPPTRDAVLQCERRIARVKYQGQGMSFGVRYSLSARPNSLVSRKTKAASHHLVIEGPKRVNRHNFILIWASWSPFEQLSSQTYWPLVKELPNSWPKSEHKLRVCTHGCPSQGLLHLGCLPYLRASP